MITQTRPQNSQGTAPKAPKPPSMQRSFLDLTKDAVTLAELQAKLVKEEASDGLRSWILPIVSIVVAVIVGLGTVPVLLMAIGECLVVVGGLSRPAAYGIATAIGLVATALLGGVGWLVLRSRLNLFERSTQEFQHNFAWLKSVLGSDKH